MRYFNTEGICRPNEHYMVRLEDRLEKSKRCMWTERSILLSTGDDNMARQRRSGLLQST